MSSRLGARGMAATPAAVVADAQGTVLPSALSVASLSSGVKVEGACTTQVIDKSLIRAQESAVGHGHGKEAS